MSRGGWIWKNGAWQVPDANWVWEVGAFQVVESDWDVGIDMLWHPWYLNLLPNPGTGEPDLDEANEYIVFAYQGSIRLFGTGFNSGTINGNNPTLGALYLTNGNYQDQRGNFFACTRVNAAAWTVFGGVSFLDITANVDDVLLTQIVGGGALACLNIYGWATPRPFDVGVVVRLVALPAAGEVSWLWWGGSLTNGSAGVCITEDGQVQLRISSTDPASASAWSVPLLQHTYVAGAEIGVLVKVDPAAPAAYEIWVDSNQLVPDLPVDTSPFPDMNLNEPFMLGRGPVTGVTMGNTVGFFAKWRFGWDFGSGLNDSGVQFSLLGGATSVQFIDSLSVSTEAWVMRRVDDTKMDVQIPDLPDGPYSVTVTNGTGPSRALPMNIVSPILQTSFDEDFSDQQVVRERWMCPEYSWGGAGGVGNGGVIAANAAIIGGRLILRGQGDLCVDGNTGVGAFGVPVARKTRVGAGILTKHYAGPGTFEAWVTYPTLLGGSPVFYTFFYQEIYPGDPRYAVLLAAGYVPSGDAINGYYIVVNHEIDMEPPVGIIPGDPVDINFTHMNFNTWLGETNYNEINPTALGFALNDGLEHHLKFIWYGATDPGGARVEFYVDGNLIRTNTTNIPTCPMRIWLAYWFPSGAYEWAGTPTWTYQDFICSRIKYTADPTQVFDNTRRETYPNTTYRRFIKNNTLPPLP